MAFARFLVKKSAFLMPALLFLIFSANTATATWLLNPAEFHASAHGQTACTDCHGHVADQPLHPNPANVNKSEKIFFHADQCLDCHDDIMEDLDDGVHGSQKIKNKSDYGYCLKCHNPHTQPRLGENQVVKYQPEKPVEAQCGACHKNMSALPPFSEEDAGCMSCHQARNKEDPQDIAAIQRLCLSCHGKEGTPAQIETSTRIPLMDEKTYADTPHAGLDCTTCHENAAAFTHHHQKSVNCRQCHLPHDEKVTHDAHAGVPCQTCHLQGIMPFRDSASPALHWKRKGDLTDLSILHQMRIGEGHASCKRCHFAGNDFGAASMVLPAKSMLCMPCHTATFSLNDTISIFALVIFLCGMVLFVAVLLTGTMAHITSTNPLLKLLQALFDMLRVVFSPRIIKILKALFWDAFLQRHLYRRSPGRWFIHGLIFYPFVLRFFWGLTALLGSLWSPGNSTVWDMINKNHPLTAFLFDFTGIMILTGIILAWVRGAIQERSQVDGTPSQDRIALALIGGIVIIGFLLEGLRIVMTGYPENAGYSFAGYCISLWFSPSRGLPEVYSFMWYIHAALTGAFIAYIPFSRLLHMILAPVVISINAVSPTHGAHDENPKAENRDFGFQI